MLHSFVRHVARSRMWLDGVERSFISIKHRLQHHPTFLLFSVVNKNVAFVWPSCSILLNACMPTKLTCDYLYPWQWFTGYGCLGVATWMLRYGMANEESATVPTPFHGQHKAVGKIKKLEKLFPSVYIACTRGVVGAPCWGFELKSAARPFLFSSF